MTTRMADRAPEHLRTVQLDTVALVDIHRTTGTPSDPIAAHSSEVTMEMVADDAYSTLADRLSRAHFDRVATTIARRRSLTDSLQVALAAHWDSVVAHRHGHLAANGMQAQRLDATAPVTAPASPTGGVDDWLALIADTHHVRWEIPRDQLTLLVASTLDGLTMSYLASGDPEPARAVLRVMAYQVAQYGRRPAKNQQH